MMSDESFWLAVAAAAPVIALANTVSITDASSVFFGGKVKFIWSTDNAVILCYISILITSVFNLGLQAYVLSSALGSLSSGKNTSSVSRATYWLVIGLFYILVAIIGSAGLRYLISKKE
jgi:hypothetical protein